MGFPRNVHSRKSDIKVWGPDIRSVYLNLHVSSFNPCQLAERRTGHFYGASGLCGILREGLDEGGVPLGSNLLFGAELSQQLRCRSLALPNGYLHRRLSTLGGSSRNVSAHRLTASAWHARSGHPLIRHRIKRFLKS